MTRFDDRSDRALSIFVSYAVRDADHVEKLEVDLVGQGHVVHRDVRILGGTEWWAQICTWIREADVVLFAVTPTSVKSRYCLVELQYAADLARPILPMTLLETALDLLPQPVRSIESVDYRRRGVEEAIALFKALFLVQLTALPATLPEPPAAPVNPVQPIRDRLEQKTTLTAAEQDAMLEQLEEIFEAGEDIALDVIQTMRNHRDLLQRIGPRLDALLDRAHDPSAPSAATRGLVRAIVTTSKKDGGLLPILGSGLTDVLLGSRRDLARSLAIRHSFPMSRHLQEDLPQVAQYVAVNSSRETLYDDHSALLEKKLREIIGDEAVSRDLTLDEMLIAAWDRRNPNVPDPHALLAELRCPVYITAHPSRLLEHALIAAGRDPVTHVCRWDPGLDTSPWPDLPNATSDPNYRPSLDQPIVFHAFGVYDAPDTLVLTEDDYFRFLIGVSSNYLLIPTSVQAALAKSALLVVGFRLEDWDFRTLWRALTNADGVGRGNQRHVAAQVDLADSAVSPTDARVYLEKYFGPRFNKIEPALEIFWGSVSDLTAAITAERRGDQ